MSLVQYRKQSEYWLLRPRGSQLTLDKDSVAHRRERLEKVPNWLLACLLVRAMPRVLSPINRDQNRIEADGLHYVVKSKATIRGHQLVAVKVEPFFGTFTGKGVLNVSVATFSNVQAHRLPNGDLPHQVAKLRRFTFDTITQRLIHCPSGEYVKKALYPNNKNRVKAIDLSNSNTLEAYYKTRLGVISMFLEDIEDVYSGAFEITLRTIQADDHNLLHKNLMAHSYKAIHQWFENHPVHIVNKSQTLGAEQQLLAELSAKHIPATVSEVLQPKQLTILIVDRKESYKEAPESDPYQVLRAEYPEAVIQSCYPESLIGKGRDSVVDVLLKELLVKFEVRHRQLQLGYPTLPSNAWFIHPVKPDVGDANKVAWPLSYCRVGAERLEFGWVTADMEESLKMNLTPAEQRQVFTGYERADVIFWPDSDEFMLITDTSAITLPNEAKVYQLIKELDKTTASGVPTKLLEGYLACHKEELEGSKLQKDLVKLLGAHMQIIPVSSFKAISYKSKSNQAFYHYLVECGYRIKTSWRSAEDGPMYITAGIWRDRENGFYSIGSAGPSKQDLDNFHHIYNVTSTLPGAIPEWFWQSLMVWHIKHKSATVYPWVFKHLREFGAREMLNQQS